MREVAEPSCAMRHSTLSRICKDVVMLSVRAFQKDAQEGNAVQSRVRNKVFTMTGRKSSKRKKSVVVCDTEFGHE